MAQPRIASRTPNACAACYSQYPDRIHVDYASALEGRLVDPSAPRGGHVDWVIICENCLRAGVALLPEDKSKTEAFEQRIADLEEQLTQTQAYADRVEDALAARPATRAAKPKTAPRKNRYEKDAA
jgi:hypothetical protein